MRNSGETNKNQGRATRGKFRRTASAAWTLSVIVSLVLSVLTISQNPAAASETDGVDISCPSGTTFDETDLTCKSTTTKEVDAESETTYSCPDGSKAVAKTSGKDLQCETTTTEKVPAMRTDTWKCPANSTEAGGSGPSLKCEREETTLQAAPPVKKTDYSCKDGFTLETDPSPICTRVVTETVEVEREVDERHSCPDGFALRLDPPRCVIPTPFGDLPAPGLLMTETQYNCPIGTNRATGGGAALRCFIDSQRTVTAQAIAKDTYSCPKGFEAKGSGAATTCSKQTKVKTSVPAQKVTKLSCPKDAKPADDAMCEVTKVVKVPAEATTTYTCPDGSVAVDGTSGKGLKCQVTTGTAVPAAITCGGRTVTVDLNQGDKPTRGHDVILGTQGPDTINGKKGDDIICGWGGNDTIKGSAGSDTIFGGNGNDKVKGGGGKDTIHGGQDDDILAGGGGKDVINGGNGDDDIDGGSGKDTAYGDGGDDNVDGGKGRDTLHGGDGTDTCDGGPGKNKIGKTCEK